jgi:hypothetical protein
MSVNNRKPVYPQVPSEVTREKGVHFPLPITSTSVTAGSLPSFANQVQTTVSNETVNLVFSIPGLTTGQTSVLSSQAYLVVAGTVILSATDTGKLTPQTVSIPTVSGATITPPTIRFRARTSAGTSNVIKTSGFAQAGSQVGGDGTLRPGITYTQVQIVAALTISATGTVKAQKITIPVTVVLSGGSLT